MRKKLTDEQKKERYEKQKAKFREWYAKPENKAKKQAENQAWKDAHRQKTRDYSRNKYYERRKVTLVGAHRKEFTITVWFINRAEMNNWLRANDLKANKNHLVKTELELTAGIWVKAVKEYYVSLYENIIGEKCLNFSNSDK